MFRAGSRRALAVAAVVAAGAVGVGVSLGASGPAHGRGPLAAAVSSLPASTTVAGFTDWDHVSQVGSLTTARERDLVTRSALVDIAPGMTDVLGVRLRDLDWEVYGQGGFGEAAAVRLKRAVPTEARLRRAGYRLNTVTGVWSATGRLAAQEPLYTHVAVLPKNDVLVAGTGPRPVAAIADVVRGGTDSFADHRDVADAVAALGDVHTALVQVQGLGCDATEPRRDRDSALQVEAAEQRFGKLERYGTVARGLWDTSGDTQDFRAAMTFPSAAGAAAQARIRGAMSHGPFIGRSGDMSEVLDLRSAGSDGRTATLAYDHPADSEYLMTGQGPLLPVSC